MSASETMVEAWTERCGFSCYVLLCSGAERKNCDGLRTSRISILPPGLPNVCGKFSHDRTACEGKQHRNVTRGHNDDNTEIKIWAVNMNFDRSCGLVARVPGYRSSGPAFGSRLYQVFWGIVGLERGPLSLVSITEELRA
jgi:hypothetical protein